MLNDYRNTKYCLTFDNIKLKKKEFLNFFKNDHPRAKNMYSYINSNNGTNWKYKLKFSECYNLKCSYCGYGGNDMFYDKWQFEIDHFIYKNSDQFSFAVESGNINNLVLSCVNCNRKKSNFEIIDKYYKQLHPDIDIKNTFIRDDMFYIKISEAFEDDEYIKAFYNKLQLGSQLHRLDYLLMNLIGLQKKYEDNIDIHDKLYNIIKILKFKRNLL